VRAVVDEHSLELLGRRLVGDLNFKNSREGSVILAVERAGEEEL